MATLQKILLSITTACGLLSITAGSFFGEAVFARIFAVAITAFGAFLISLIWE